MTINLNEVKYTIGLNSNCDKVATKVTCVGFKEGRPILLNCGVRVLGEVNDTYFDTRKECRNSF